MDLRWEAKMGVLCEVEELGCDGAAEEGGQEERGGWTGEPPPLMQKGYQMDRFCIQWLDERASHWFSYGIRHTNVSA